VADGIVVDYDADGRIVNLEILHALRRSGDLFAMKQFMFQFSERTTLCICGKRSRSRAAGFAAASRQQRSSHPIAPVKYGSTFNRTRSALEASQTRKVQTYRGDWNLCRCTHPSEGIDPSRSTWSRPLAIPIRTAAGTTVGELV
jgi:hypothetical protein